MYLMSGRTYVATGLLALYSFARCVLRRDDVECLGRKHCNENSLDKG